ncbi:hypothetical protein Mal52_38690 [Symmachiella dynata]|uniref:Uncharacterized protein n=1 Tax=Symmachiella dynata TaxID=2527995 RepID=A0A517ZSI5_9PLAN|nr:hypothetical protein Mal52_38690 [Symmachiella dynata]
MSIRKASTCVGYVECNQRKLTSKRYPQRSTTIHKFICPGAPFAVFATLREAFFNYVRPESPSCTKPESEYALSATQQPLPSKEIVPRDG